MKRTLRFYITAALLCLAVGVAAYLALRSVFSGSSLTTEAEERIERTPAVVDSIRSIGQWELASVELSVDVDTIRKRWIGLVKDEVKRRYTGRLSVGIDMTQLQDSCYAVSGDTITVTLPAVRLLDTNFIDESRTRTLIADNEEFADNPQVKKAMLEKARRRLAAQGADSETVAECRQRAAAEVKERFSAIGYSTVVVVFE